jgi:hypothetical protein
LLLVAPLLTALADLLIREEAGGGEKGRCSVAALFACVLSALVLLALLCGCVVLCCALPCPFPLRGRAAPLSSAQLSSAQLPLALLVQLQTKTPAQQQQSQALIEAKTND